jgi:hypothetical protein
MVIVLALLTCCAIFWSCSSRTSRRIAFDLESSDAHLKKKIGLSYLRNQTSFGDPGLNTIFERELVTHLAKSGPDLLIKKSGDQDFPDEIIEPPLLASGRIDNLALALEARRSGINDVVVCTLQNVHQEQEETGMLWFKGSRAFVVVQVLVEVYDSLTAAKVLEENYEHEIELDEVGSQMIRNDMTLTTRIIVDALTEIMPDLSEDISDAVLTKPWRGFIKAATGDKVFIASGRRVGVRKEDRYAVHACDRILDGVAGERFFLPAEPYAEIKVTTVFPEWSEAVILKGGPLKENSYLRPLK